MARRRILPAEPFELRIDHLLENGRGQAQVEGRSLQVHDALPGERVRARYLFGRRFRGQAQTVEVLDPAPERVPPRCRHFGACSACSLQHLALPAQVARKQQWLLDHLQAHGGLKPGRMLAPLQADAWQYRRKARLSVRYVAAKGRVLVGFRERGGRFVADLGECHVLRAPVAERLGDLARVVDSLAARAAIPQIEVACGDERCALVFRHLVPLDDADRERLRAFQRETSLAVWLQPGGPDTAQPLAPDAAPLSYALPEYALEFAFWPLDFIQVNGALNRLMVRQALELLAPTGSDRILDLFCGLGNFTLPLAQHSRAVTGVEADPALVERARDNARRNGVANARFESADLYADGGRPAWLADGFDLVLLDPPRAGAGPALAWLAGLGARRILYVSCNPVTMASDAARLVTEHGYLLGAAGVLDMFPHTTHMESMALFERP